MACNYEMSGIKTADTIGTILEGELSSTISSADDELPILAIGGVYENTVKEVKDDDMGVLKPVDANGANISEQQLLRQNVRRPKIDFCVFDCSPNGLVRASPD